MDVRLFVSCLARAFAKDALGTVLTPFGLRWLPDGLADYYDKRKEPRTRLLELEAVVVTPASEMRRIAGECLAGAQGVAVPEVKAQEFAAYMSQVPGVLGRSLRRAEDPQGRTVPLDLVCARPQELVRLLPQGMPRFRPDQAPLRGLDLRLVELLGVGGFGEVWKACNPRQPHAPPVALKFCLDPLAAASLQREAHLLDRVMHEARLPGIVRLRQTYLDAEPPFLEYEYVDGGELTALIGEWHRAERGGPTPEQAARVVLRLARIMAPVHGLRPPIVHRDLKPGNILVTREQGEPRFWIADFGIGDVAAEAEIAATTGGQSRSGVEAPVSGYSALYASPQQRRGEKAVPQDDVYALGVVWYQLLSGDLGQGAPTGEGWRRRLRARGATDPMLEVLTSCFEHDAEDRPRDGEALAAELERVLDGGTRKAAPESQPSGQTAGDRPAAGGRRLPEGLVVVSSAAYADVRGLAPGSAEAQERQRRFAQETGLPIEIENTIGMRLRLIPPGRFLMGSPSAEKGRFSTEDPQHQVEIVDGLYVGVYQVTQGDWETVMGQNPSQFTNVGKGAPVEEVSWDDCQTFIGNLSRKEGVSAETYRLLSEAEWEYACRAGTTSAFYGGEITQPEGKDPVLDRLGWFDKNSGSTTHPVGKKAPNAFGLCDMHGNVWEWCEDDWHGSYSGAPADGSAWVDSPRGSARVDRGGSWNCFAWICRSAYRSWDVPGLRYGSLGFRLARQLPLASAR